MKEKITTASLLRFFFSNYLWFGIVIVLISVVCDNYLDTKNFLVKSTIDTIEAVGIAIVVAAFFTFASGTSEFLDKISDLLRDIVIGKDFLTNLDTESKKNVLSSVIKPSFEERKTYLNIEDYFNTYINKTMEVTKISVRSNYNLLHRAYICLEKKIVVVETILNYRLYPGIDGYTPIRAAFYAEDKNSYCSYIIINTPSGKRDVITNGELNYEDIDTEVGLLKVSAIDASPYNQFSHLDVEMKLMEYGYDHWGVAEMQFLLPTDGFKYQLRCEDNLEIKQYSTFVHGAKFFIDKPVKHEMSISCTGWINEGTGFSIVIGPNDQLSCFCKENKEGSVLHNSLNDNKHEE